MPLPEVLKVTLGSSGSLLFTVKVALFEPSEVGAKLMVIGFDLPASILKGVEGPIEVNSNLPELLVMLFIVRMAPPSL
jgi:hypothetical protein